MHFGLLLDTRGPRPVLALSGILGALSFCLLFFFWQYKLDLNDHAWVLFLVLFLQGQAMNATDMSTVPVISKRFGGAAKGSALGLCKSFLGLSGSLMEQVYIAFFRPNGPGFMLFIAVWFPTVCLLGCIFLVFTEDPKVDWPSPARLRQREIDAERVIGTVLRWIPALFALLLASIFSPRLYEDNESPRAIAISFALLIMSAFASILWYISRQRETELDDGSVESRINQREEGQEQIMNLETPGQVVQAPSGTALEEEENVAQESLLPRQPLAQVQVSMTPSQAFRGADFWLQAICVLVTWGSSLIVVLNMGQLVEIVGLGHNV